MTFKQLADRVISEEGKKRSVNIAQINEILRIALITLAADPIGAIKLLTRYKDKSL